MASAKLANKTVNQSQSVICRLKPKFLGSRRSKAVVITLPTSTTNITGLPIMCRGSNFTKESARARAMILGSQIAFLELLLAMFKLLRKSYQPPAAGVQELVPDSVRGRT